MPERHGARALGVGVGPAATPEAESLRSRPRSSEAAPGVGVGPHASKKCLHALIVVLVLTAGTTAHDFSQSESTIEIAGPDVRVRLSLNLLELPDVDISRDGRVSYDELDHAIERVFGLVKAHFTVRAPDPVARVRVDRHAIVEDHVLQMDLRYQFSHLVTSIDVESTLDALMGATHQHFATAKINGELQRVVLDASNQSAHFDASRVTMGRIGVVLFAGVALALLAWYRRKPRLDA